jgi:hypothetical protein
MVDTKLGVVTESSKTHQPDDFYPGAISSYAALLNGKPPEGLASFSSIHELIEGLRLDVSNCLLTSTLLPEQDT